MSSGNNSHLYNTNFVAAAAAAAAASGAPSHHSAMAGRSQQIDFAPPSAVRNNMPGSIIASQSKAKGVTQKLSKSKTGTASSAGRNTSNVVKGSIAGSNVNKTTSKIGSGPKSTGTSATNSRQMQSTTTLEFNTPKQNQLLSQCDYIDRTIWATRVLWGGNSVNGFLRATATAQRIKKQRARQNNSTKMSRAAKAASTTGVARGATAGEEKGATAIGSNALTNAKLNSSILSGTKAKEIFNQHEEELLKKEIMNPRTAKKLKSELEAGLTFCATVCNVLRGVLFDIDHTLSPSLPPHLAVELEKPPPAHTFLIPSNPLPGSSVSKGSSKSKAYTNPGIKGAGANKNSGISKQHESQQPNTAQNTTSSPGDPGSSTLRRLRKTNKKNKGPSIFTEPAFANFPPEKGTSTKKEYLHRAFQLLRYRDLREGDFCAARLSSRDLWILAKVLKDYKTDSVTPLYTRSPLEFLSLSDAKRDALFQKERVLLEDVEDQQTQSGTQVIRSLVLPLPRSSPEANEWANRLIKKGSRVYAMYPQTTSLYAATVTDSTTYCRGDDDIIVVQFDGEDADVVTGQFPSYHVR